MSWLDDLMAQLSASTQNGDSPADAVPSEPATSDTFNAAKDSSDASKFFSAFFGGEKSGTDASSPDASAANYRNGSDMQSDANPSESMVAQSKPSMSMLDGILNKINLKHTADGSIDYSDPSTIDKVLKLVMAGGNVMSALMNRGQPQGYKTAAQLQAEIKSPLSSWTPTQQATANSFFGKQLQGPNHELAFAANMPNPIVPGKGYATGGAIPPPPTTATSMSFNNGQWAPTPSTPSAGYNPNYMAPSASSMGDWINGTGALGEQHTDLGYLNTLENASMANTGHALTMDQYTGLWGQDPTKVMSDMGWTMPGGSTAGTGLNASSIPSGLAGMQSAFGAAAGMAGSNPGIDANPNPSVIGGTFAGQRPADVGWTMPAGAGSAGAGFNPSAAGAGFNPTQQTPTDGPAGPMPVGLNGVTLNQLQAARRAGYDPNSTFAQYWQQQPGKHGDMRFDMHAASGAYGLRGNGAGGANQGPHVLPPPGAPVSALQPKPPVTPGALGSAIVPWTTNSPSAAAYGPQHMYRGGRVAGFADGGSVMPAGNAFSSGPLGIAQSGAPTGFTGGGGFNPGMMPPVSAPTGSSFPASTPPAGLGPFSNGQPSMAPSGSGQFGQPNGQPNGQPSMSPPGYPSAFGSSFRPLPPVSPTGYGANPMGAPSSSPTGAWNAGPNGGGMSTGFATPQSMPIQPGHLGRPSQMPPVHGFGPPQMSPRPIQGFAHGGALGHVMANTGGQDDVVPIRAAGGEYMFDAATVSDLGDGNNAAGAKKLDAMRENIRAHKRSAPINKIPPKAKQPMQYMKKGA